MKKPTKNKLHCVILFLALVWGSRTIAQQDTGAAATAADSVVAEEMVNLKYYALNNREQYLLLENFMKEGKKKTPLKNKAFRVYLDSLAPTHLLGNITTNGNGLAKATIPPSLSDAWNASASHTFLAEAMAKEGEAAAELPVTRAKIEIDTASEEGVRTITIKVLQMNGSNWEPVPDVEMKAGVKRLGGILPGGEEESYTTDSSGTVTVTFNKDSLPGNAKGEILLAVRIDDNDVVGNLQAEKKVNWGKAVKYDNHFFDQRTLWSTRYRTPFWLLFMAYSIVLSVWGALIYIVLQLLKIKKMGKGVSEPAAV